ncbi:AlpA family transcriptional regulator [Sulfitobacter sp. SK012]|uniref:helix-turn-helix transcriptional regulator n=1 Tax=Sulfitobacter sp. SK012 TaxID=1389005 RepID=UPI000E0C469E|nr:helix-turn-helix domain-containing protein [Sulfitobacter sp. SK012]AXI47534.1 AlpA family transcriptional regulator [Sulfitobacter sp. SK012]
MNKVNSDRLMTRQEVEERLGISKRFLEVSAAQKLGPALFRIGRSVRYSEADIRLWIDQQRDDLSA